MWPTIISIGPLAIQSFGLMMILGVFFGGFVFWQKGREEGVAEEMLMDSWLLSGVGALIIGRTIYVLNNWSFFEGNWYKILFMTKYPGLSYEGVFLGAILMMVILAIKYKQEVFKWLEISVLAWLVVEMFGLVGSFLGGSFLGAQTGWFWGIGFPGVEGRRHPVQLVLLLVLFLNYQILVRWEKEYRGFKWYSFGKGEAKTGFLIGAYLSLLGLARFLVSLLTKKVSWFGIGLVVLGGLVILIRMGKKKKLNRVENVKIVKKALIKRKKQGFDFK